MNRKIPYEAKTNNTYKRLLAIKEEQKQYLSG